VTMVACAAVCVPFYDANSRTLIDFALGVMAFAFTGMLGVFLTALLTRRGNTISVLAALAAGVASVVLMQPGILPRWTGVLLHQPCKLASTWWMPLGTIVSFAVCVAGRPADSRRGFEPVLKQQGSRKPQTRSTK
jgi:SSS family solute:Na+ symporter